jgi:eukaryotic-like serine/threonine-protein kinase
MGVAASPGHVIAGRYRVDRLLGRGGMGSVWAATHLVTHKSVALKLIDDGDHDGGGPGTPGRANTRRRFAREARAASAVAHPNIVGVHDVFETEDGTPVMVMDLLVGEPLDYRLVRAGRMGIAETASILLPVVSAVGSVHARGVVHRDLKPANIFLAEEGGRVVVKVLDFGLAKLSSAEQAIGESSALTSTGAMMGTPYYMAPEQCAGEREIDHRVDVWAIGVILYECLAGRRPITADNLGQVIKKVLIDGVPPLEDAVPGLPEDIYALVRRMLARERRDRPDDLREVKEVLARYAGEGVTVPPFGPPAAVISEPQTPAPDPVVRHAIPIRPSADSRAEITFQSGSGERLAAREERAPVSARVQRGIAGVAVGAAALIGVVIFLYRAGGVEVTGSTGRTETVATIAPLPPAPVLERSELELPIPVTASASAPAPPATSRPPVAAKRRPPAPGPPATSSATAEAPPSPPAPSAPAPARRGVIRDPRF